MGWLEKSDIKLISTQVVVEVEVGVELGNIFVQIISVCTLIFFYKNSLIRKSKLKMPEV